MSVLIKTEEQLNTDMLANISADYEKSPGFLTGDLIKTNAIELGKLYAAIQQLIDKIDVNNLEGAELTRYVLQRRGIKRTEATKAKVELTLSGTGVINIGDLFSAANNIQFSSTETKSITTSGTVLAECTEVGQIGMVGANSIVQFPITLTGFSSVVNNQASYDGFEEESDISLRERYYNAIRKGATSGNIFHYMEWGNQVLGVGKTKVFPLWNGANTVKVLIINDNMQPASIDLISATQEHIDPKGIFDAGSNTWSTWGTGCGQAPIGAYCTVESAIALQINIVVDVDLATGHTIEQVQSNIESVVSEYLKSIAFSETNYVSISKIGSLIMQTAGVIDYRGLLLNGSSTTNVLVGAEEVAVLGTVGVS